MKKFFSSVSLILIIGCMFLLASCAKDIYTPSTPATFVDGIEHASAIFGKEYLYPENDENINYVIVYSDKHRDEYKYKKYKDVSMVGINLGNVNDKSISFHLYKNSQDSTTGSYQYCKREYELFSANIKAVKGYKVNGREVYGLHSNYVTLEFYYLDILYQVNIKICDKDEFEDEYMKPTWEQIDMARENARDIIYRLRFYD